MVERASTSTVTTQNTTRHFYSASASYITGTHSVKVGFQDQHGYEKYNNDSNGALQTKFGSGLINDPHGFHVDREGNVWFGTSAGLDRFSETRAISFSAREALRASAS